MEKPSEQDMIFFCNQLYSTRSHTGIPSLKDYISQTVLHNPEHNYTTIRHAHNWLETYFYQSADHSDANTKVNDQLHRLFQLGKGGHKRIYLGRNIETGQFVAIGKEAELPEDYELNLLDTLTDLCKSSPDLFQFYGHVEREKPESCYTVSQLYGQTLKDFLNTHPLSPPGRLKIALSLCNLVDRHHTLKIFLGDLKEENILLDPKTERFVYVDFGSSRIINSPYENNILCVEGTPGMFSPHIFSPCISGKTSLEPQTDLALIFASDTYTLALILLDLISNYDQSVYNRLEQNKSHLKDSAFKTYSERHTDLLELELQLDELHQCKANRKKYNVLKSDIKKYESDLKKQFEQFKTKYGIRFPQAENQTTERGVSICRDRLRTKFTSIKDGMVLINRKAFQRYLNLPAQSQTNGSISPSDLPNTLPLLESILMSESTTVTPKQLHDALQLDLTSLTLKSPATTTQLSQSKLPDLNRDSSDFVTAKTTLPTLKKQLASRSQLPPITEESPPPTTTGTSIETIV